MRNAVLATLVLTLVSSSDAAEFRITDFGAAPNDGRDDTVRIRAALKACGDAGGGTVVVPRGTFLVARQASDSPILSIPSDTTVRGEGDASLLKFAPGVNDSNLLMQFGYADHLVLRGNTILAEHSEGIGIYVWGRSRYNPEPPKQIVIENNTLRLRGQPISFNGVRGGVVRGNVIRGSEAKSVVSMTRCENVLVDDGAHATPSKETNPN